jgi:hypothetical protein
MSRSQLFVARDGTSVPAKWMFVSFWRRLAAARAGAIDLGLQSAFCRYR